MSSTLSERGLDLEIPEADLNQPDEILSAKEFDITSFLIEHGSKIVTGHDGQPVSVAEAYDNCDAFRRLVHAMGERALFLAAARLPEEQIEEEAEETDETEKIGNGLEEKQQVEKSEQKPSRIERMEQKSPEKKADNAPKASQQNAVQEVATPAFAKAAPANKSPDTKPDISQARERSWEPPSGVALSGSAPQETKADTVSISERSQDIVKAAHPTTEAGSARGTEPATITQEAPALKFPELAKNAHLSGSEEIEEMHDLTFPPEAEDGASFIGHGQERSFVEDEEHQIILAEADVDFFLDEIVEPEAEVFLESELVIADGQWANDEVVRLREFRAGEEIDANSVLFIEISGAGNAEVLPIEDVEQTVQELAARIEAIDTEAAETVFEILDKIALKIGAIHAPLQVVENGQEDKESDQVKTGVTEIETKLEEELRGLFIELFDYVGMEYTSELIDAFTKLALKLDILELTPKKELIEKQISNPSQGTHEIIKQLLGALTAIKQAAKRAYAIGKSVLLLYRRQLAAA